MKKILSVLLVILMMASFVSCGEKADETDTTAKVEETTVDVSTLSPAQHMYADFKEKVTADKTAADLADELINNDWIPFGPATMPVEPGFLNGFTEEIKDFAEGATFGPMIGAIPFVGYVFKLADGADVDAFMKTLKDTADLRWNICTQADELVCEAEGNTVFFVMAPATFEEE